MLSPSHQQHSNSPIMSLPNEVIDMILSYVLANPFYTPDIGQAVVRLADSPVLVVRSVCRRFRQIADRMPFWNNENFELRNLIPLSPAEYTKSFHNALLSDRCLAQHLQRKTSWRFSDLPSFLAVIEGVPSFLQNIQSIKFIEFDSYSRGYYDTLLPSSIDIAISQLGNCPRLISLILDSSSNDLSIGHIGDYCPLLEYLEIDVPYFVVRTLDALTNLRKIHIRGSSVLLRLLLPMGSIASLQSLKIEFWPSNSDFIDATRTLDAFANLTTLHIQPMCAEICEFLKRSQLQLVSFGTRSNLGDAAIMVDVLSAPCLQKVEHLMFHDRFGLLYPDIARIVESIIKLVFIQHLELEMLLDLEFCHQFRSLSNLKKLFWKVREDEYIDVPFVSLGIESDVQDYFYTSDEKAEKVFSAVFANFPQMPQITVEIQILPPLMDDVDSLGLLYETDEDEEPWADWEQYDLG